MLLGALGGIVPGSGGDGDPTAEEIEEAIERARSIQMLEAGRLAASNNPTRPAAIEQALREGKITAAGADDAYGFGGSSQ